MEKLKKSHPKHLKDQFLVDFAREGNPTLSELKQPIRIIEFRIGSIVCRIPRSADDPTPDNVVKIGGLYHNLSDGRMSTDMASVNGNHQPK
jgi:hypothetical protein